MASSLTPDLCVIGAGASGMAVAIAARRIGATVVVVEPDPGGKSLRSGPLALRALAAAAEKAAAATGGEPFGVLAETPRISFRKVHDHISEVARARVPDFGSARLGALGIERVQDLGRFIDPRTIKAGDTTIRARRFVIATGGAPTVPNLPGLLSVPYFTTETIFDNTRKLSHLVIVGAGPLGLDLGLSFRRLGCEVTILEPGRALPHADPELASIALRRLREAGVVLYEEAEIVGIQARSQGIGVTINAGEGAVGLDASHILVASGRIANLAGLNTEAARIRRAKSDPSALSLSPSLRTTNPKVYAVGEAAGHAPMPHIAGLEADLVVRAALLGQPARYEPAAVPRLTLTDPPIAEIGLTEPMARGRFRSGFTVYRASYAESDMARASRDGMGVVKLLVSGAGRVLGAGICGAGAGDLAALFALAIEQSIPAARLADLATAYPSHADLVRQLGAMAGGTAVPSAWQTRLLALNRLLP